MADGSASLRAYVDRLRALPELAEASAPAIAAAVEREIAAQIARGEGPDGQPWEPTKDGGKPLQGAAKAVRVRAVGDVIVIRVDGHHARHHRGWVKGGVRRQIIPTRSIPDPVTRVIRDVVTREFSLHMGGR